MPNKPEPMRLPNGVVAEFEHIAPVFAEELCRQELDDDTRYVDIPEGIREMYKIYRPSPLCRAYNLEQALGTPAKIYYKFEGNNTSGSHKLNSALAQAYYAHEQGLSTITTETGAGQWGTALSEAAAHFGLDCDVFMVRASYEQKPFRRSVMQTFGANVTPSPSDTTEIGRKMLENPANYTGSLGTAISEAVERALHVPENRGRYQLGSVLNQVLLHQSIIGLESETALEQLGEYPDVVVGCAGGGSNLGGLIAPFMRDKLTGVKPDTRFVAVEPASCPSLTRGRFAYDFADTGQTCPLVQDVHAGQRLHPQPRPRRRPALPRHEPHHLASSSTTATSRPWPSSRPTSSPPPSSSPSSRPSCPPPRARTPSAAPSTRPRSARRPARRRSSSSASRARATST